MSFGVTRRAFLRGLVGLAGSALAISVPILGCSHPTYTASPKDLKLFTNKQWSVLDAAAKRLAPAHQRLVDGHDMGVANTADQLFSTGNARLKADLARLLDTFEDDPWLAGSWKPFTQMTPQEQDSYLNNWMTSSLGVKRQAFVGLNRLVQMVYFMDPRSWPDIGYDGPWVGRLDVGLGLDNQGPLAANPNPNVFAPFSGVTP
jgi:hypothetical protein